MKLKMMSAAWALCLASSAAFAQEAEEVAKPVIVPPPPAGKAEVVFFRQPGYAGSAISCAVQENGAKVASLPPGRFFIVVAETGRHTYTTASSGTDNGVFFDLKPGDIKYVGCTIVPGFWVGKADLEIPIRDDAFSTKMWKQVTPDRIVSPNVLTKAQLAAAMATSSASPAAAPVPAVASAPATAAPATVPAATPAVAAPSPSAGAAVTSPTPAAVTTTPVTK